MTNKKLKDLGMKVYRTERELIEAGFNLTNSNPRTYAKVEGERMMVYTNLPQVYERTFDGKPNDWVKRKTGVSLENS